MVYGAVQQNGGRIEVVSEPNQGTTFRIFLPPVDGAPAQPSARTAAADGSRRATIVLASLRPVPELLITDVVMPGMNGRVLAERAAAMLPGLRVLFVSGYAEDAIVERGILKSGIEFLAKPYSIEQLARRIREVLDADTPP
jgi:CheY-like chemotaxis protein